MNVHEYQAKKILAENGIKVPPGGVAYTPAEANRAENIFPRPVDAQSTNSGRRTRYGTFY